MDFHSLDPIDRRILYELDLDCRISSAELGELIGKSRQTVEYRIKQLQEAGVITGFQASVNPHAMGLRLFKLYLKLRNIPSEKDQLLELLRNTKNVYWMGECSGTWDLVAALHVDNDYEFFQFKNNLRSYFNEIIVDEAGDSFIDVLQFPKMWLTEDLHPPVLFGGKIVPVRLSELEMQVLRALVQDAKTPITTLAKELNASPNTIKAKIKKLEEKKVIIQYRVAIDYQKLGLQLYKAMIRFERYTDQEEECFKEFTSNLPHIQYYIRNMWQHELEFMTLDYNHYLEITDTIRNEFPYLIRSIDSVLMLTDEWTPRFGV